MVWRNSSKCSHYLVLLSLNDDNWKIIDFGVTTEGSSRQARTTRRARGTECYRAPELVSDDSRASNKADIFSLGCVSYELAFGRKAFSGDLCVFRYATFKQKLDVPVDELNLDYRGRAYLSQIINRMLEIDWWRRPSACDILDQLNWLPSEKAPILYTGREIMIERRSCLWENALWSSIWQVPKF